MKELTRKKAAKLWLMWLVFWPFVGITAAFVVFIAVLWLMLLVVGLDSTDQPPSDSATIFMGLVILIVTAILAAIFFIFAKNMKTKEAASHSDIIGGKVLYGYTWVGILLGIGLAGVVAVMPTDSSYEQVYEPDNTDSGNQQLERDPELVSVLRDIGAADARDISITYMDTLPNQNWLGAYRTYTWEADNSFAHGEIKILRAQPDQSTLYRTVAHEYLHHVWESKLDRQTRDNLTSHLITLHGRNSYMQQRVNEYSHEGTLLPTEIFAFACTEFSDGWLTEYLINQCNTYINRGALQMVF